VADIVTSAEPSGPDPDHFVAFLIDWSEAFFHSMLFDEMTEVHRKEQLFIEVPGFDTGHMADHAREAVARGEKVYRRLLREVPGTKRAPQSWFITLVTELVATCGAVQSKLDPCLLWFIDAADRDKYAGYGGIHVDDMRGRAKRSTVESLRTTLGERYKVKVQVVEVGDTYEYVGERYQECEDCVLQDQYQYIENKLHEIELASGRYKKRDSKCSDDELSGFRTAQGSLAWVTQRTRTEHQYESSVASTRFNALHVRDMLRLNKSIRLVKDDRWRYKVRIPKLRKDKGFRVVTVPDAGEGELKADDWTKAQGGRVVGIMSGGLLGDPGEMAVVDVRSVKLKRVTHSSFDAETVNAIDTIDVALGVVELIHEWQNGVCPGRVEVMQNWLQTHEWPEEKDPVPIEMHTDCRDLVDNVESLSMKTTLTKRRRIDVADLKEMRMRGQLRRLLHLSGKHIPTDALTKQKVFTKQTMVRLVELFKTGYYEPITC